MALWNVRINGEKTVLVEAVDVHAAVGQVAKKHLGSCIKAKRGNYFYTFNGNKLYAQ